MTKDDLQIILTNNQEQYKLILNQINIGVERAERRISRPDPLYSTHDGFNLSAQCGKLQEIAARIELLEQLISYAK